MTRTYEDIQSEYLVEVHKIIPSVLEWWRARAVRPPSLDEGKPQNDFEARWPLGPAAHPRILHVVRIYFLQTYELNRENERRRTPRDDAPNESDWGTDDKGDDVKFYLPIDLLVNDIEEVDPDVYEVVSGLVFVPVGLSPAGEYC